jgi:membrane protein involved in colicin uptake
MLTNVPNAFHAERLQARKGQTDDARESLRKALQQHEAQEQAAPAAEKKKTAAASAAAPPASAAQAYVQGFVRGCVAAAYRLLGTLEHQV